MKGVYAKTAAPAQKAHLIRLWLETRSEVSIGYLSHRVAHMQCSELFKPLLNVWSVQCCLWHCAL